MWRFVQNVLRGVRAHASLIPRSTPVRSVSCFTDDVLQVHPDVRSALDSGRPVVALETTIVTHGMPYPDNIQTALCVEEIARSYGVTPATIGIINGQVFVGLTTSQLEMLGNPSIDQSRKFKVSRRDLAYVLSQGYSGGTTVSGTMVCAHKVGIPLFVTGGVGGVHRDGENTLDVSADLTELGRTPVGVVCAGAKSILDIGRTLEYLETQGVTVASYGESKDFPAFFSPKSGYEAPYSVSNPLEAAKLIDANLTFGVQSGILIGVPVPSSDGYLGDKIEVSVQQAIKEAHAEGVIGKSITPFLLDRVNKLTGGRSLETNIELIKNNVRVGCEIAVELANLRKKDKQSNIKNDKVGDKKPLRKSKDIYKPSRQPVVIGASILDFTAKVKSPEIKHEGTNPGSLVQTFGGVGRNVAECMSRLGSPPFFISSIGNDTSGKTVAHHLTQTGMSLEGVREIEDLPTATYCAVLDNNGEMFCAVGDMDINQCVSVDWVRQFSEQMADAPLVCMDGNIPTDTIKFVCDFCSDAGVPVWYEPTCVDKATKPILADCHSKITYTSPNLSELRNMYNTLTHKPTNSGLSTELSLSEKLSECFDLSFSLLPHIPNIIVSLGKDGVLVCSDKEPKYLHYPPAASHLLPVGVASVNGAGDSFVGAAIVGLINGHTFDLSVKAGLKAAYSSVKSHHAVCSELSHELITEESIQTWAPWEPIVVTRQYTGL